MYLVEVYQIFIIHKVQVHHHCIVQLLGTSNEVHKLDSDSKQIRQKFYQFFINVKLKKISYFFTNYVPYEITKEFLKNSAFENMTAGFLIRSQNTRR